MEVVNQTQKLISRLADKTRLMARAHELSEDELRALQKACRDLRRRISENLDALKKMLNQCGTRNQAEAEKRAYDELKKELFSLHDITVSVINDLHEKIRSTDDEIKRVRKTQNALKSYKYHQFD